MSNTIQVNVFADVKKALVGLERVNRKLEQMDRKAGKADRGFAGLSKRMKSLRMPDLKMPDLTGVAKVSAIITGITAAVGALSAALAPAIGLVLALTAAIGAAGVGFAAFGFMVFPALKSTFTGIGEVTKVQEELNAALKSGDTEAITKAQEKYKAALDALSPSQRRVYDEFSKFKTAWEKASEKFSEPILDVLADGLKVLTSILPQIERIATPAMTAIIEQINRFLDALKSPGFEEFVQYMERNVGPVITSISNMFASLAGVIWNIMKAAEPVLGEFLAILEDIFETLNQASAGEGLMNFMKAILPAAQQLGELIKAAGNVFVQLFSAVVPVAEPVLKILTDILNVLANTFSSDSFSAALKGIVGLLGTLSPVLDIVLNALFEVIGVLGGALADTISSLTPFIQQFASTFVQILEGVTPLLPVLAQLVGSIGEALLPALGKLIPAIASALIPVVQALAEQLPALAPEFLKIVDAIIPLLPLIADVLINIIPIIPKVVELISALVEWYAATGNIQSALKILADVVKAAGQIISGVCDLLIGILTGDWGRAWNGAVTLVKGAWNLIVAAVKFAINSVISLIATVDPNVRKYFNQAWESAKSLTVGGFVKIVSSIGSGVVKAVGVVKTLPSKITAVFSSAGSLLLSAGKRIMDGLISGIREGISRVRDLLNSVTDMIPDWKGPASKDAKLLYGAGLLIMKGLVAGLEKGEDGVRRQLYDLTNFIENGFDGINPTITPAIAGMSGIKLSGDDYNRGTVTQNFYELKFEVPANVDKVELGRIVTESIDAFESAGGRRKA